MKHALVDTSVVKRFGDVDVGAAIEDRLVRGWLALCAPVRFEVCFSARNLRHLAELEHAMEPFAEVPIRPSMFDRALEVQAELCRTGRHRAVSMADLLIAAAAEATGIPVLHYDRDFELIASVTGQPVRWVVPPGTVA